METLIQQLRRQLTFNLRKAERQAEAYAETWADFSRLSEDEQDEAVEDYLSIALNEHYRTNALVNKLIEIADLYSASCNGESVTLNELNEILIQMENRK